MTARDSRRRSGAVGDKKKQLDAGLPSEQKRYYTDLLVRGILIGTRMDENGNRFPLAHVICRSRRPIPGPPISIELLFLDAGHSVELSRTGAVPRQFYRTPFTLERDLEL